MQRFFPFVILGIVLVFALLIMSSFFYLSSDQENADTKNPLIPPPGSSFQVITPEIEMKISHDEKVGQLIKKLPYQTKNFSLEYDFSENKFIYWYKVGKKDIADTEFLRFLTENGIEKQEWLTNLVIQSEE